MYSVNGVLVLKFGAIEFQEYALPNAAYGEHGLKCPMHVLLMLVHPALPQVALSLSLSQSTALKAMQHTVTHGLVKVTSKLTSTTA